MISDQALTRWACEPGPAVEEFLAGEIATALLRYADHHRIQLDKVPWLDLNAGHSVPALLFPDVPWGYHSLIAERGLYGAVKDLQVKHAYAECMALETMLGLGLKEPVGVLSAVAGHETVRDDQFISLEAYQQGERAWVTLASQWLTKQRHRAAVVALVAPCEFGPCLPDATTIQGDQQSVHIWLNPKLVKPVQHWTAPLVPNPWKWVTPESWVDGERAKLVRKGDHLEPRYATEDEVLRLMEHVWKSVPEHDSWADKARVRLGGLKLDHLAAQPTWKQLQDTMFYTLTSQVALGPGVEPLLRNRQHKIQHLLTPYPDNGSQECRYWLLTVGDQVRRSDGASLEVTQYMPSAKTGQPPTIHLEECHGDHP